MTQSDDRKRQLEAMFAKPRAPDGLKARGRKFWDLAWTHWGFYPPEAQVLIEACRTIDVVEQLDRAAREAPGDVDRVIRVQREARQQRRELSRLLAQLQLPDPRTLEQMPTPTQTRARHAANVRWGNFGKEGDPGGVATQ